MLEKWGDCCLINSLVEVGHPSIVDSWILGSICGHRSSVYLIRLCRILQLGNVGDEIPFGQRPSIKQRQKERNFKCVVFHVCLLVNYINCKYLDMYDMYISEFVYIVI